MPEWIHARLGEVCLSRTLVDPRKTPDRQFDYVDVSSISNLTFTVEKTTPLFGRDAPSRARQLIRQGDVLFATVRPTLRRVAMIPRDLDGMVCSTGFCVIRCDQQRLIPSFAYYYLLTDRVYQFVDSLQKGATYPAINDGDLLGLEIPLPPIHEQRAIAHVLTSIRRAIETRKREVALERERKAALMEYLFTHGTENEASKPTEIGEIPESWTSTDLASLVGIQSGGTPSKSHPEWWAGEIPWASPKDLKSFDLWDTEDHISVEGLNNGSRMAPEGTVLIVVRGMVLIKDVPISVTRVPMAFNQDLKALLPIEGVSARFLGYALTAKKDFIMTRVGRSAHGTGRLGTQDLLSLSIPLPSPREQEEIVNILDACDAKINALEREVDLHEELFRAMLEELMTGRLSALSLVEQAAPVADAVAP